MIQVHTIANNPAPHAMDDPDSSVLLDFFDQADMGQPIVGAMVAVFVVSVVEENEVACHWPTARVDAAVSFGKMIDSGHAVISALGAGEQV